jgi:NAD(P)-dependent dehydrogenase (short-subunit alcohol dehydrogenase family)
VALRKKQNPVPPQPLQGQTALVTGGGIRLGRAIALALAEHGCNVIVHYHSSRKEAAETARSIRAFGRTAYLLKADLSNPAAAIKLARAAEKIAPVDILINSAAVFWPTELKDLTLKELDTFLDINLKSPYALSAEIGRKMKRRGRGSILNMACLSGLKAWKAFVPYSISKAGIISLTEGLAKLLAPEVRVNAVAPGTVLPPEKMSLPEREQLRQRLPLQRLGTPDDIVSAVLYALCANFVTGQTLRVDGGRSLV